MLKKKKLLLIATMACIACSIGAQTTSPYSRYGYGVLRDQTVGPSKAMGGIGYGLRNNQSANPLNPASYSRVDSLTFLFDIGASVQFSKLSDQKESQSGYNGGLDYITILVPLKKGLGLSFGLTPYSSVGYSFGSTSTTDDNITYRKTFSGSGGFSQVYAGLGYLTPIKGLSVGANAAFMFGTISHTRSLPMVGTGANNTSTEESELNIKTLKFDIGAQYEHTLSEHRKLVVGAVYAPRINSKANFEKRHYELSAIGVTEKSDTTVVNGVDANLPSMYGLGFTLVQDNKLTLGADFTYQQWKNTKYSSEMGDELSQENRFNDKWKVALGVEYMIDPYDRSFLKKMKFRGGLNYGNSYLNVRNSLNEIKSYNEYGASLGIGLPIKDNIGGRVSYININVEYKKIKPSAKYMIDEEYIGISLNANINELWFFKNKIR